MRRFKERTQAEIDREIQEVEEDLEELAIEVDDLVKAAFEPELGDEGISIPVEADLSRRGPSAVVGSIRKLLNDVSGVVSFDEAVSRELRGSFQKVNSLRDDVAELSAELVRSEDLREAQEQAVRLVNKLKKISITPGESSVFSLDQSEARMDEVLDLLVDASEALSVEDAVGALDEAEGSLLLVEDDIEELADLVEAEAEQMDEARSRLEGRSFLGKAEDLVARFAELEQEEPTE